MSSCCDDKGCAIDELRERQSGTLKIVLAINAVMFIVEAVGGYLASSTALLSDSLDNLGDALTYGLSLYVVARSDRAKAKVALVKGALIAASRARGRGPNRLPAVCADNSDLRGDGWTRTARSCRQ